MSDLAVGEVVGRYEVQSILGSGGIAHVYLVKHNSLGSFHALKVLSGGSVALRERLILEGRAQATLRHDNIVPVTDVIEVDGWPGLVMSYVDGPNLSEWLEAYDPDADAAMMTFRSIVRGVRHAHRAGLVHRDLKPGNILMDLSDGEPTPKVMDFGLVKDSGGNNTGQSSTNPGSTMGTPEYMSPEQIRDSASVDSRADMFSLGCILYELTTGDKPFNGKNMLDTMNLVCAGVYADPGVDGAVGAAIAGLLQVSPDERIPDCDTLLNVLDGLSLQDERTEEFPFNPHSGPVSHDSIEAFETPPGPGTTLTQRDLAVFAAGFSIGALVFALLNALL